MKLYLEKLYRYDRVNEPCSFAVPFAPGKLWDTDGFAIEDNGRLLPVQAKVTARHPDGSIRYAFVRFQADIPGNKGKELEFFTDRPAAAKETITLIRQNTEIAVDTGAVSFAVSNDSAHLFSYVCREGQRYAAEQFQGPFLASGEDAYKMQFGQWKVEEQGALFVQLCNQGTLTAGRQLGLVTTLRAYLNKPWIEVAFRLVNTTMDQLPIDSWCFGVNRDIQPIQLDQESGKIYQCVGTKKLSQLTAGIDLGSIRTCVAQSNYKTAFTIGDHGTALFMKADAQGLLKESNEHMAEVLYGTFMGDVTDQRGGVCATLFQAKQNYPKAITADGNGLMIHLVPEGVDHVAMNYGMAREQRFMLHFHGAEEPLEQLDNRSLIYQMPDQPYLQPEVYEKAGVMPDIFVPEEKVHDEVETNLINRADGHARCYGMLNWGDAPDPGYSAQGRGNGSPVWTNNEYDYPHSMYLMYARTGIRRFLDYANIACDHWMDVDVCHYSDNPLEIGGQWEHTDHHTGNMKMVCSHEWVEGLLDCYHFTGNERALQTALGIGENILRLLETEEYQVSGESNARETGWAMRSLLALYLETRDEKWVGKCRWIVGHFQKWTEEYGGWLSPYTDNTSIRVGFMIAVAIGSLMRYYRVFPEEAVKELIISAVDDLVENCYMKRTGLFYYKELPSLSRNGNNTLILEALTIGYELTGDETYLKYGWKTFWSSIHSPTGSLVTAKRIVEDAVLCGSEGTKNFAQSFLPLTLYYKAIDDCGMLPRSPWKLIE